MIALKLDYPENTFECPFLEQDSDDDSLWCYFNPRVNETCHGLCNKGCPIVKDECVKVIPKDGKIEVVIEE